MPGLSVNERPSARSVPSSPSTQHRMCPFLLQWSATWPGEHSTSRTRMSPNWRVRQVAVPLSPLCNVGSMLDQSVVPNGMSVIFIALSFDGADAADFLLQQEHAVEQRLR